MALFDLIHDPETQRATISARLRLPSPEYVYRHADICAGVIQPRPSAVSFVIRHHCTFLSAPNRRHNRFFFRRGAPHIADSYPRWHRS